MIRTRLLLPLLVSLGLVMVTVGQAQAVQGGYTNGYVTQVENDWAYPIGIWDEQDRLWYPINPGTVTNWTEPTHLNVGAGYACYIDYYGSHRNYNPAYVYAPENRDGAIAVSNWGLTVDSCWRY